MQGFAGGRGIFGRYGFEGFELALDHLGGKFGGMDVELTKKDTQHKPDVGRTIMNEFIKKERVNFVAGITWSNVLAAVWKQASRSKTYLISANAGWSGMAAADSLAKANVSFVIDTKKLGGIEVKLFSANTNSVKFVNFPSSGGIEPVKLFSFKHNTVKFVKLPSSLGIAPLKLFSSNLNSVKFVKLPSSGGIAPVKLILRWLL